MESTGWVMSKLWVSGVGVGGYMLWASQLIHHDADIQVLTCGNGYCVEWCSLGVYIVYMLRGAMGYR